MRATKTNREPAQQMAIARSGNSGSGKKMPAVPVLQKFGGTYEELPAQGKFVTQLVGRPEEKEIPVQAKIVTQRKPNNTGVPDNLKTGIENLGGYASDDVKVHCNSAKPATLQAHAYAQGTDIHIASGQEKHLPHEAWHVVQQKQGRVQPTLQMKERVPVNDDAGLENEADVMGGKAMNLSIEAQVVCSLPKLKK